jgi:hypothetical protein
MKRMLWAVIKAVAFGLLVGGVPWLLHDRLHIPTHVLIYFALFGIGMTLKDLIEQDQQLEARIDQLEADLKEIWRRERSEMILRNL